MRPEAWRRVHGTFPAVAGVRAMQTVVSAPAGDAVSATPTLATTIPSPPITRDDLMLRLPSVEPAIRQA